MKTKRNNNKNYCTVCGYLETTVTFHDKCPVCSADRNMFAKYDVKHDKWVSRSVQGNITYPDIQGTDWGHPNSSLSRHVRLAVYNALKSYNPK